MKLPAVPLPHASLPWLLAVALVTTLPHGLYQPAWLSGVAGLVLLGVTWRWWRGYQVSSAWLKVLLVFAGCAGILVQYRTLLGRDAGIAMLVLFMAMKLLELKSRRDAIVVVILGYFLLLTHYFHSQDIPTGLWLLASTLVVTGALLQLHGDPQEGPRGILLQAGRLLLQALPLMLLLYLLFPRVSGPLWGLPADAHAGRTGLSNSMSPGSISELALSDEIAFRARFDGPPPPRAARYWRGPVLNHYDGREWKTEDFRLTPPSLEALDAPYTYTLTLEAHKQHWLLPLDMPSRLPQATDLGAAMTSNGLVRSKTPVTSRKNVEFTSHTQYRLGVEDPPGLLQANLQLPPGRNPRTLALARSWQRENQDPAWLVQRALQHFRQEAFSYTLSPPLLGQEAMDDFLFRTRQGFCEHYASAFVILMRAAQVPARVVTGYMGGELNPVDNFLVVRQLDAHAWAEVWLDGQGWVRVDPTAAISPGRVESGLESALPGREPLGGMVPVSMEWLKAMRHRWDALNNSWNQWVLGYTPERQREVLSRLGLDNPDWRTLIMALSTSVGLALLALAAWIFRPRRETDPARAIWKQALVRLEKQGLHCPPWESPLALARRLETEAPELAGPVQRLARLVCAARYEAKPPKMEALRLALRQLP